MEDRIQRMKELVSILREAGKAYYQESREIMSNFESSHSVGINTLPLSFSVPQCFPFSSIIRLSANLCDSLFWGRRYLHV